MKTVYYPLAGMNYIIDDLAQIIENKITCDDKAINIWLSAQVNSFPHIGTLTNFISGFILAEHFFNYFKLPVFIKVELLESVTGETIKYDNHDYYKNLVYSRHESGKSIKDYYYPYFLDILERLKEKTGIQYEVLFFYEYQKNILVKEALFEVINNAALLKNILDPKAGEIRLRVPCPRCGITEKHIWKTSFIQNKNEIRVNSFCPEHGDFFVDINTDSDAIFDMNVPLRYLVKALFLLKSDELNMTKSVLVDGGDWSGMWPLRIYMESLIKLGKRSVPCVIYTPTITDWSGSKLSKRMYVGENAYREYNLEGLFNYSLLYKEYGEDAFDTLFAEINNWVKDPKKFIRDYSVEYMNGVLRKNN